MRPYWTLSIGSYNVYPSFPLGDFHDGRFYPSAEDWPKFSLRICLLTAQVRFLISLRAGSLVWVGDNEPRIGEPCEKNEARKSEPARELLIFEFRPSRGVKLAFHMCQITIQWE